MAIAKHKSRRSELREGRELARRVQRGDRWAFQVLYASYEGALFRFGHRLTGSSEAAAALVDATFARALATLPEDGLDSVDVGAHLFATARSLSYGRDGNGDGNGNGNGTARYAVAGEHAREVVAANARLAPRQRMTLALRDLEGRPDEEIALALGAESPSVPALVARARLRLREELALPATTAGCATHLADLSAYTDRTLPADRRAGLETHLEGCADCRAALFALREAAERYRAVPVPVPPGELSARMAAALDAAGLLERRATPVEDPAPAAAPPAAPASVAAPPPAPAVAPPAVADPAPVLAPPAAPVSVAAPVPAPAPALAPPSVTDAAPASPPASAPAAPVPPPAPAPARFVVPIPRPSAGPAVAAVAEPAVAAPPAAEVPPMVVEALAAAAATAAASAAEVPAVAVEAPVEVAATAAEIPPATVEAPVAAPAQGGRQTAAAVVMAAIVLLGIVVTLLARNGGDQAPVPGFPTLTAGQAPATAAGGRQAPAATPAAQAPVVVAAAGGRGPGLAAPPKLRHHRSGTRVYPHHALPVKPPVEPPAVSRASTRRSAAATPARTAPQTRATAEPKPIPAPAHKIAVQVVQPIAPPSTATPADATPPDSSAPPGGATTTST